MFILMIRMKTLKEQFFAPVKSCLGMYMQILFDRILKWTTKVFLKTNVISAIRFLDSDGLK